MKLIIVCVTLASLAGSLSADLLDFRPGPLRSGPQPEDKSKVTLSVYGAGYAEFKDLDPEMTVGEFKDIAFQYYEIPRDKFSLRTHRYYKDEEKIMDDTKTLKDYGIKNTGSLYGNVIYLDTDFMYRTRRVIISLPDELKSKKFTSSSGYKNSLDIDVKWNTTIREIKEKIAEKLELPVEKLKLSKKYIQFSDDDI